MLKLQTRNPFQRNVGHKFGQTVHLVKSDVLPRRITKKIIEEGKTK